MLLLLRQRVPSLWGGLQDVSVPRSERLLLSGVVVFAIARPAHTTPELVAPLVQPAMVVRRGVVDSHSVGERRGGRRVRGFAAGVLR
jgi:hypothetical protein